MPLFARKPLARLLGDAEGAVTLRRTLGPTNLVALGVGSIIGAGLFVRTAAGVANNAGPSVTLSFVIAGIGCAFAGLCYAEFASMIPIAGSAYTYAYATMGELPAWIIGWDLVLEYGIGGATVAIAWSEYVNKLLEFLPGAHTIPFQWCHSPFEVSSAGVRGIMNVPSLFILLAMTALLVRGIKESAIFNGIVVVAKVTIVLLIITIGWRFIDPANHTPYIPQAATVVDSQGVAHHYGGLWGILGAAGVVFFAFIGFDAVSTTAQESRNPKRDMPVGILGSLVVCTVLYILFAHVLTGIAPVDDFRTAGREASVAYAIAHHMPGYEWLAKLVTVAIVAGFTSVVLVILMGQARVFYSMSRDGLLPRVFSDIHPRYRTPWKSQLIILAGTGSFAAFLPVDLVGDMTSIGTLFAFVVVCAGVWIMRVRDPLAPRQFRTPLVPLVPICGILVNAAMIFGLGWPNWARLGGWLAIGLVIYFGYSRRRSKLAVESLVPAQVTFPGK